MSNIKISKTEWEVMRVLWTQGESLSQEVVAILSDKLDWSPSTIKTLLARLVKKNYLGTHKDGNRYRYYPLISENEGLQKTRMALANHICSTQMGQYIADLINENDLSHNDIALIEKTLKSKARDALDAVPCNCIKGQCKCSDACCPQK